MATLLDPAVQYHKCRYFTNNKDSIYCFSLIIVASQVGGGACLSYLLRKIENKEFN